jgi:hypothetical protein
MGQNDNYSYIQPVPPLVKIRDRAVLVKCKFIGEQVGLGLHNSDVPKPRQLCSGGWTVNS